MKLYWLKDEMEELSRCSTCPFCDVPLRTNDSIQHIGTIHSYVENFLPAEHHVKKLPPGGNKRRSVENKRQNKSDEKEVSEKIGKEDEEQFEEQSHNHFQWAGMQAKVSLQMWGKLSRR